MKILFIAHSFPYPPDEGIKLMSYNLIKQFSKNHTVTLLSLIEDETEINYIPKISNYCKRIEVVVNKIPQSQFLRLWNIFFQSYPFCIYQFYSKEFINKLRLLIENEPFDILHFDFVNTSIYRDFINIKLPSIYFPHDAMSMLFKRNITKEKNIFRKIYTYAQYKKMLSYESKIIPKFTKTVVVSPVDRNWLLKINSSFDISVIPNGVDAEYFKPTEIEQDYPSVIFRGIMSFLPNIDAAIYFYRSILPLIRKEIPNIKFYIVGKNPTQEIKNLNDNKSVIVTGYVKDIRVYILKSTVNVCPMRIGSGIKNKILESMALAKPTVATKIACDGIPDVKDGSNIIIADNPEEFSRKVITLIKNRRLCEEIGNNARKFVIENYSWEKVAKKFIDVYQEAIDINKII